MDGGEFVREYVTRDGKIISSELLPSEFSSFKLQAANEVEWSGAKALASIHPEGDGSGILMNPSYPVATTFLTNSSSNAAADPQLLFTLQLPAANVIDSSDDNKADLSQTLSLLAGAKIAAAPLNQFTTNGNVQLNMQGISGVPQLAPIGVPGVQVYNNGSLAQPLASLNQSTNTVPIAIQQLPQTLGVAQILIASAGQLVQGVQGTQLLVQPSTTALATPQQIVTIPYNQLAPGQQFFTGPNGQLMTTSINSVQTFASPPQNAAGNSLQSQTLFANNLSVVGLNQNQSIQPVFTASNGQILTISPQCPNIVQVYGSASAPLSADKLFQPINTNANQIISSTKGTISTANQTVLPTQTHIQVTTSTETQAVQKSTSTEIVQQTSSPSITSTESSTPISQTCANTVDGINLEEIKEFAKLFKIRRLSLGLTQTQVGQALNVAEGPAYSQSAICRFEKLDITPKSAQKIKPVLERWMKEAEERYKNGAMHLTDFIGTEPSKKRKRRTSFTPQALDVLNRHFDTNTHPSGSEMTDLADKLNYDREVVRVWFCNKRQTLKNTVKKVKSEFL